MSTESFNVIMMIVCIFIIAIGIAIIKDDIDELKKEIKKIKEMEG